MVKSILSFLFSFDKVKLHCIRHFLVSIDFVVLFLCLETEDVFSFMLIIINMKYHLCNFFNMLKKKVTFPFFIMHIEMSFSPYHIVVGLHLCLQCLMCLLLILFICIVL